MVVSQYSRASAAPSLRFITRQAELSLSLSFLSSRSFSSLHLGTDSFNGAFAAYARVRNARRMYRLIVWGRGDCPYRGVSSRQVATSTRVPAVEIERGGERARWLVTVWGIFLVAVSWCAVFSNRSSLIKNRFNDKRDLATHVYYVYVYYRGWYIYIF